MEKLMNVKTNGVVASMLVREWVQWRELRRKRCGVKRIVWKPRKQSEPSGVAILMISCSRISYQRILRSLVPVFKGKGNPLNPNFYRGIKLLEHTFKLYKKVMDGRVCEVVDIDKMQNGFMSVSGTVDAVFVLRRLQSQIQSQKKRSRFLYSLT